VKKVTRRNFIRAGGFQGMLRVQAGSSKGCRPGLEMQSDYRFLDPCGPRLRGVSFGAVAVVVGLCGTKIHANASRHSLAEQVDQAVIPDGMTSLSDEIGRRQARREDKKAQSGKGHVLRNPVLLLHSGSIGCPTLREVGWGHDALLCPTLGIGYKMVQR
jgi:hypothetical protein